jgi:hypothetical protein
MLTNVYSNYNINKSFYNCIKSALHEFKTMGGTPLDMFVKNISKKFMDQQDQILLNIKEKDHRWYPLSNTKLFTTCYYLHPLAKINHKTNRIHDYATGSYEQLPSLDLNIFDIFLVLCINPFIISNLLTKDLIKLLANFGTVGDRLVACLAIMVNAIRNNNKLYSEKQVDDEQAVNQFITHLYEECDKELIYHIKPAQKNVNIDIKSSNEHFKILNRYLNLFSQALDRTLSSYVVPLVTTHEIPT